MNYKISFCTVCMNRLHHIKETLPKNIKDNLDYPELDFVLLDYNSSDNLMEWVYTEMSDHINTGRLKYYRTEEPEYFDRSHSRNMMMKLATGDIICNIDADNFAGEGFATFLNNEFLKNENIYLVADTKKRYYFLRNAFGRFCVKRETFLALGGLDEEMKSYGSETVDFYERLEVKGIKEVVIQNTKFLKAISHGDEERISNEFFLQSLFKFYLRFISSEESEFLILYKDNSFESGFIVPERIETHLPAALKENTFIKGVWKEVNNGIELLGRDYSIGLSYENENLISETRIFYPVEDRGLLLNIAKNYSFITNVEKKKKNIDSHNIIVNAGISGRGSVYTMDRKVIAVQ